MRRQFLLVISHREALAWILSEQRMAFARSRYKAVDTLASGDRLVLYTTRSCFRNPTKDRGRIIGTATVTSCLHTLEPPVTFGERTFERGCSIHVERLVPAGQGPEIAYLVDGLGTFPTSWGIHIRRTLVPLDENDFGLLDRSLAKADVGRETALPSYIERTRAVRQRKGART